MDDLLKLCVLTHEVFGLPQLRDLLNVRRIHSYVICRELTPANDAIFRGLTDSAEPALAARNFIGLIANCILADCVESAAELAAIYLGKAAEIAVNGPFDTGFKRAFALVALDQAHALSVDLSVFLRVLTETESTGESYLRQLLKGMSDDRLQYFALKLLNAGKKAEPILRSAV